MSQCTRIDGFIAALMTPPLLSHNLSVDGHVLWKELSNKVLKSCRTSSLFFFMRKPPQEEYHDYLTIHHKNPYGSTTLGSGGMEIS